MERERENRAAAGVFAVEAVNYPPPPPLLSGGQIVAAASVEHITL